MSGHDDSVTAVELVDPLVGTIFDKRFRVDERLAAGGFGAIYRATHVKSGHKIALKVLHPSLASDLGVLARFRREGTTLTSLRNPHTITAYEFGQVDKTLFIVLELLYGATLYDVYEVGGPLEWKRVVHIAKQVCESLEEAHAQGIVHRDLKPTNIHLERHGDDPDYVKVLDFGIAKILRGSDHASDDITNVGQMIGTLDYMSPEQMVGGQVTGQTDIYTLGILMYEMIAGTRPFPESQNAGAALAAMLKTTPDPLYLRAPVPRELDAIVMRCLERETSKRFRSVHELHAELERIVASPVRASTATVTLAKRYDDNDETKITPPPEKVLDALRTPKMEPMIVSMADAAKTPRVDKVDPMAQTVDARTVRPSDARTPSLDVKTPKVERRPVVPEWGDDDEGAPTTTRRPDGYDTPAPAARRPDDHHSQLGAARRPDDHSQLGAARRPDDHSQLGAARRPDDHSQLGAARRPDGNQSQLGAARRPDDHSQLGAARRPDGSQLGGARRPDENHSQLGGARRPDEQQSPAMPQSAFAPQPTPRPLQAKHVPTPVPQLVVAPFSSTPKSQPGQQRPRTPTAQQPPAIPFSSTTVGVPPGPRTPTPGAQYPHLAAPPVPVTPPTGHYQRAKTGGYDMSRIAARDAAIRRLIWIVVMVVGAGVGFIVATQL